VTCRSPRGWRPGAVAYRTITGCLPLQQPFRERGFVLPGRLPADVAAAADHMEGVVERPEALLAAVHAIERTIADEVVFSPA